METKLAEVHDMEQLVLSLDLARDVITKDYLYKLGGYEVAEIPEKLKQLDIAVYTRIYKFTKMVSDQKENVIDKLVTVLNAAYSGNATVVTLICGHKSVTEYYMGVVSKNIEQESIETQGAAFESALMGNFPGLKIEPISNPKKKELIQAAFANDHITSISGIASIRNEKESSYEKFVQGIEHLVDSLQGKEYNVVVIADPVSTLEIADTKVGYETLYTQLSPFLKSSVSFNESETITLTQSHTEGITKSVGESISLTQNYSKTSGWSESSSYGRSTNRDIGHFAGSILGMGVGAAAAVLAGGKKMPIIAMAAHVGGQIGGQMGGAVIGARGENIQQGAAHNENVVEGVGKVTARNAATARQEAEGNAKARGETHGKILQFSNENKTVKNLLNRIDKHIERLQKCEAYGAFNCAAYVISSDPETNAIVSGGYNGLMRGDNSSLQASYINHWCASNDKGERVKEYLAKLSHPRFQSPMDDDVILSPASILNSYELAVNIGLPKKSINGLPVFEMAAFGRNVFETNVPEKDQKKICLGEVCHMGATQEIPVELDIKSLAMHTFITGSTGSGKSNTVYQMLRELHKQQVHYLVIEPAKGEYKHVFSESDAAVYGINPYVSPLLKINPFRFPEGIHVLEHIDRLIEIFNVCWPMYAAMPAVLKDSVERAYISAGWDLASSRNKYSDSLFPTFVDILAELTNVVMESAFSQEVKDNYIGSLATRVKSLTNGIYGSIFDNDELGDKRLFDEDVIVDLSRVGSLETKSMIMGILVMRLQEYRMTSGRMNADLNHVTVLEEAHNLLRKTSAEQSSESSNLLGKSVEMLSNAIAEVRTYGEGFIVADQAPGLLDMSVIRNTNTKIIMRLPDGADRKLVGESANLNEAQIKELAKLPTGTAAIYQNDWLEPVLCQIHYEKTNSFYRYESGPNQLVGNSESNLVKRLLNKVAGERLDVNMDEITDEIIRSSLKTRNKIAAISLLKKNGPVSLKDISPLIYDVVCTPEVEAESEQADSIEEWKNALLYVEGSVGSAFSEERQNQIIECILQEQIRRYNKPDAYLETWHRYMRGEVI